MAAALLAGYAAAASLLGPTVLRRGWAGRAPRLAIGLWLALPVSWVVAVALAVLTVAAPLALSWPASPPRGGPALLAGQAVPGGTAVTAAGLLLAAAVVLRAGACVASGLARGRRGWREQATFLEAVGRVDRGLGAVILDHDAPIVYCLPSGRHRVVVTTAALTVLGSAQLHAVLAHERAHLRGRHHVTLTVATALARAFPRAPLLAQAGAEIAVLAEMAADDSAARLHHKGDLAAALVVLARAGVHAGALTAGGPAAMARVQRLLAPPPRPGWPARTARLATGAAMLTLPVAIACLPLIAVACDVVGRP
jgi:hypothetical protein